MASTPRLSAWAARTRLSFVLLQATWAMTVTFPPAAFITCSNVSFLSSTLW